MKTECTIDCKIPERTIFAMKEEQEEEEKSGVKVVQERRKCSREKGKSTYAVVLHTTAW